jgi:hypothetical protein
MTGRRRLPSPPVEGSSNSKFAGGNILGVCLPALSFLLSPVALPRCGVVSLFEPRTP